MVTLCWMEFSMLETASHTADASSVPLMLRLRTDLNCRVFRNRQLLLSSLHELEG